MLTSRRAFLSTSAATMAAALAPSVLVRAQAHRPMADIIVVIPGIMGSTLRKDGKDVWSLSGPALVSGLRDLDRTARSLILDADSPDAALLGDGVTPDRIIPTLHMLPGLWKVDGYSTLVRAITSEFDARPQLNYFEFAYDWRRDNRSSARVLARLTKEWLKNWRDASGNKDAKLILLAHSMGGLVARYFLEVLGGWRDTRMLVTFGTPFRGSLKALGALANGLKPSVGQVTLVDLSALVRSFTSTYQLLPTYPCYDPGSGVLHRIDVIKGIAGFDATRAKAALDFHTEMRAAVEQNARDAEYQSRRYSFHPVVGTHQPTPQIGRRSTDRILILDEHPLTDAAGDGTVPHRSATPIEPEWAEKQQRTVFVAERHATLQNSDVVLNHLRALLAEGSIPAGAFRAESRAVSLAIEDVYSGREAIRVKVGCDEGSPLLAVSVTELQMGREVVRKVVKGTAGRMQPVDCGRLAEGVYRLRAVASDGGSVSDTFVVARV